MPAGSVAWDAVVGMAGVFGDAIFFENGVAHRGPIASVEKDGVYVLISLSWTAQRRMVSTPLQRAQLDWYEDEPLVLRLLTTDDQMIPLLRRGEVKIPLGADNFLMLVPIELGVLDHRCVKARALAAAG